MFKDRDSVLARYYKAEKEHDMMTRLQETFKLQVMGDLYDEAENRCIRENSDNVVALCLIYKRLQYLKFENMYNYFILIYYYIGVNNSLYFGERM